MRFYLQRKDSWFNDNFLCIADENRKQLYNLDASIMLMKKTIRILDADKNEVAVVKQELKSLTPKYSVYVNDEKQVTVKKLLNPLIPKYELEGNGWNLKLDLLHGKYDVYRSDRLIATVIREYDFDRPVREIDMADCTANERMTALALVVAIEYGINFESLKTANEKADNN